MIQAIPSRTALRVALRRAAHQLHDRPLVFVDPVAIPILGAAYCEELHRTPKRDDRPWSSALRAFLVARSRHAEDALQLAVDAGVRQYLLLGAGLDTFAYRNPRDQLRVFEVDHPATQQWKRSLVASARLTHPAALTYVPVDFEEQSLADQLLSTGFSFQTPTFVSWLGVVPYLTLAAFRSTIQCLATLPLRSGLALDYGQPRSVLPPEEQLQHDSLAARVRQAGEPFQLFFTPAEIAAELSGFTTVEDIGRDEINARYFAGRTDMLKVRGQAGRLLVAWRS